MSYVRSSARTSAHYSTEGIEPTAMPSLILNVDSASLLALNLPEGPLRKRMDALAARKPCVHGNHLARFVVGVRPADRALIRRTLGRMNTKTGDGKAILAQLDSLRLAGGAETMP